MLILLIAPLPEQLQPQGKQFQGPLECIYHLTQRMISKYGRTLHNSMFFTDRRSPPNTSPGSFYVSRARLVGVGEMCAIVSCQRPADLYEGRVAIAEKHDMSQFAIHKSGASGVCPSLVYSIATCCLTPWNASGPGSKQLSSVQLHMSCSALETCPIWMLSFQNRQV